MVPDSMQYRKEHSAALKLEYKISTAFSNEMQLVAASGFDIMIFVLFELASACRSRGIGLNLKSQTLVSL